MASSQLPASDRPDEDASLIAAQEAFLSSGTRPAAKIIRTTKQPPTKQEPIPEDNKVENEEEGVRGSGPGWYQQMKGVRFRLDDLESDDEEPNIRPEPRRGSVKLENKDAGDGGAVIGDIIERQTTNALPVFSRGSQTTTAGFPAPRKFGRPSKRKEEETPVPTATEAEDATFHAEGKELMEEIDRENRKKLAEMSEEEILELQRSLRATLPPGLQEILLNKSSTSTTTVSAPEEPTQSAASPPVSKSKAKSQSLDDKSFDDHLRTFFSPSTTSVGQPEWTLPVHPAEETFYATPDASKPQANTMRFDLKGTYIPPSTSRSLPTHLGLHHHSLDPGAAGYTLAELAILARSVQPSQKCIALKIIGFVLADVAKGKYEWDVTEGLWDEIEQERVIEILLDVAKGGRESGGNQSVQRYAEDAVTRWLNANGPKLWEERLQKKGYERVE